jgi:hypothetical protein
VTRPSRATRGARRKPLNTFTAADHDPLSDSRLRPLVERYAALAGARLDEVGPHLFALGVPEEDRAFFDGRERVLAAFAVAALDHSPDGEMAVIGSPFVEQLLAAIRARGARLSFGVVTPRAATDAAAPPPLSVPVRNGTAAKPTVGVARHPIGRLLARVLVRAGASVEEHLVESDFFDLAAGAPLPRDVADRCAAVEHATLAPAAARDGVPTAELAPARPVGQLVELMVADLRARLAPRVEQLRADAERALVMELARIDKYYGAMREDVVAKQPDAIAMAEAGRAIEAEHARRRLEEERRHQVRAVVHPLQIVEMEMLVQRAAWTLSTPKGRRATLSARRFLGGPGTWSLTCPTCACEPSALLVCREGEVACDSCASAAKGSALTRERPRAMWTTRPRARSTCARAARAAASTARPTRGPAQRAHTLRARAASLRAPIAAAKCARVTLPRAPTTHRWVAGVSARGAWSTARGDEASRSAGTRPSSARPAIGLSARSTKRRVSSTPRCTARRTSHGPISRDGSFARPTVRRALTSRTQSSRQTSSRRVRFARGRRAERTSMSARTAAAACASASGSRPPRGARPAGNLHPT